VTYPPQRITEVELEPGQTLDLGDLRTEVELPERPKAASLQSFGQG
jgi:hypothetical protein